MLGCIESILYHAAVGHILLYDTTAHLLPLACLTLTDAWAAMVCRYHWCVPLQSLLGQTHGYHLLEIPGFPLHYVSLGMMRTQGSPGMAASHARVGGWVPGLHWTMHVY